MVQMFDVRKNSVMRLLTHPAVRLNSPQRHLSATNWGLGLVAQKYETCLNTSGMGLELEGASGPSLPSLDNITRR